ncbi:hypothetical protein AM493_17445 [Flavobacterium akiainvivens]|uniref:Macroglobulin domain-containing protein n=1 Tax=Flavobacterium akiainvivens TaxID=1202724 RepID=A0A0M9VJC9_9FLAO|nr:hypothetical protein [Flavobacterium akiainvivens]KOS07626.1 hypothetical protein AM493_17445 [Flavobacterium akiainvivens]SFQ23018.1 hypothetical protein SAMN05444144_10270 [Flavobacterium akiainvivens]
MKNLTFIIALLFSLALKAQHPPVAFTYVHIDKNIYVPGETIWLKAYMPSTTGKANETLLVRLTDNQKNIVAAREFAAYDLRAHGQLVLPDSIRPGNYTLMAYGNNTGIDAADVFTQSISVINNIEGAPVAAVTVSEGTIMKPGNPVTLQFSLLRNGRPVVDAKGRFTVTAQGSNKPILNDRLRTDASGLASVTFTYPDIDAHAHLSVEGAFTISGKAVPLNLVLPSQQRKIGVTAVPEGGTAIMGTPCGISIQALDDMGQPVKDMAVNLLENGTTVQTAVTNIQGVALIRHTVKNATYSVTAAHPSESFSATIPLEVKKVGVSLSVQGNRLLIANGSLPQTVKLELWSQGEELFTKDLTLPAGAAMPVVLPQEAAHKIISAALYSAQGKLLSERLFYTGTQNGYTVTVDFGSKQSATRQKVNAALTVTNAEGKPVQANLSAAVVHRNLVDKTRYKTITASRYSAIDSPNTIQQILKLDNAQVNNYLASKKWRGNFSSITGILPIKAGAQGHILPKRKKDPPLAEIIMMIPDGPTSFSPNADGSFYISPENLMVAEGEDCFLFFNDGELGKNTLTFTNDAVDFDNKWLANASFELPQYRLAAQTAVLPDIPGAYRLEEVVIEKKRRGYSDADYQKWVRDYPANCMDYVCEYNILNCKNHLSGFKPIIGGRYFVDGREMLYTQCLRGGSQEPEKVVLLKTITLPEDFPEMVFEDEYDMKFYTTLHWQPNVITDEHGKATVTFTTSDLEGEFLMVLQGLNIENNEAIYGEAVLDVSGNSR